MSTPDGAKSTKLEAGKSKTTRDSSYLSHTLESGALILVFSPGASIGAARVLNQVTVAEAESALQDLIRSVNGHSNPERLKAKIVSTQAHLDVIGAACASLKLEIQAQAIVTYPTRVFCQPACGRILFEKQNPSPQATQSREPVAAQKKIRVLLVDDSKTVLSVLRKMLSKDPGIEVVGAIQNPLQIEESIQRYKPDVVTLDVHMPEMDGCSALERYLPKFPIPTVMITSISHREAPEILRALELGAVDYLQKPDFNEIDQASDRMIEIVRAASQAKVAKRSQRRSEIKRSPVVRKPRTQSPLSRLIAIGSSTGGTEALKDLLLQLPDEIPPIVCVQHIPPVFSAAFAERLNQLCPFEVKEAQDGDELKPGRVLIAPGGIHMSLEIKGGVTRARLQDTPPVNRHKPSVDVLFESVAQLFSSSAIGVILTGMGADGAKGLLSMRQKGAKTVAQNEKTCVVFGMPREAIRLGAAMEVRPLDGIGETLLQWLEGS